MFTVKVLLTFNSLAAYVESTGTDVILNIHLDGLGAQSLGSHAASSVVCMLLELPGSVVL
jgi:hypothetical protein